MTSVHLAAPLVPIWRYKPKGAGLGFVRSGDGAVFTNIGHKWLLTRLSLETGKPVWQEKTGSLSSVTRWKDDLLAWRATILSSLDFGTGERKWTRECEMGSSSGFVVDDFFINILRKGFQAMDMRTFDVVWRAPNRPRTPLVSDGEYVIAADKGVVCRDLKSGVVRWDRPRSDFGVDGPHADARHVGCIWQGQFICFMGPVLTSLDVGSGKTLWKWELPKDDVIHWWHPYDGLGHMITSSYVVVELSNGKVAFERKLGPLVPELSKRKGFVFGRRKGNSSRWRDVTVTVSESHTFLLDGSGRLVALARESGEIQQVTEIEGMSAQAEPIIYKNHLLVIDIDATLYCFRGRDPSR